ncbi:MAG: hypothetical protein U9N77_08505 [Thermodesulfobacteriota bacterium]|nr:hypothetical protein [Thermodesulfobacteriota bacterium]
MKQIITKRSVVQQISALAFMVSFFFFFLPLTCSALEKLSDNQMHKITAQSGITAYINDAVVFYDSPDLKFKDVGTCDKNGNPFSVDGYLKFDFKALVVMDGRFDMDIGGFYEEDQLSFMDNTASGDVTRFFDNPLNNVGMLFLTHSGDDHSFIFQFNNIKVFDHESGNEIAMGDLELSDIKIFESRLDLFPPVEGDCGIRFVGGTRFEMGNVKFSGTDHEMDLTLSGIMAGSSISGSPDDPDSWEFDDGKFQMGLPYYYNDIPGQDDTALASNPFSLDITYDENRLCDNKAYIAVNAPVQGSIRIKEITTHGDTSFGPMAVDGIRLYKNIIEFPGRGIGN